MTTLTVTTTHDYSGDALSNVTDIVFNSSTSSFAAFAASQFDGVHISASAHFTNIGTGNAIVQLEVAAAATFSAAGWTFSNWVPAAISISGSTGAEHITGSSQNDAISVSGADIVDGGGGNDTFTISAPSDIASGAQLSGGSGTDVLFEINDGTYDFSNVTLSGIEEFAFGNTATSTAIFTSAQFAQFTAVQSTGGHSSALVVNGSNSNLVPRIRGE